MRNNNYKDDNKLLADHFEKLLYHDVRGNKSNFSKLRANLKFIMKKRGVLDFDFNTWYDSKKDIQL